MVNINNCIKNFLILILLICLGVLCHLIYPQNSIAGVDLPWSTTFDCPEWGQYSDPLDCNGLKKRGAWTCNGKYEKIIAKANFLGGGGGKGQRHCKGDGSNVNSGGLALEFNSPQRELWIRWYMRYELGFKWDKLHYDKILYIHTKRKHVAAIVEWYCSNAFDIVAQAAGGRYPCKKCGWMSVMRGRESDGRWHFYEVHIKIDTNGRNGVAEAWIDGKKILSKNMIIFGGQKGWTWILIGSNQSSPNNGRCMAVDFDDIAISNLGRIGLLDKETNNLLGQNNVEYKIKKTEKIDSEPPEPPTRLRVIQK